MRYYVKYQGRRGVCFIREYVPKHCIALIANRLYNEPYIAFPMESTKEDIGEGNWAIRHRIWREKDKFTLDVRVGGNASIPPSDSAAHFFKEHDLGFGKDKKGETLAYFVEHPVWATQEVQSLNLDFDFGKLYGPEWAFLTGLPPTFITYALGSEIKVYSALRLQELEQDERFKAEK